MFDDPKKQLQRLQEQLLQEEEPRQWPGEEAPEDDDEEAEPSPSPVRRRRALGSNNDHADLDLDEYSDEIHDAPMGRGCGRFLILLCAALLGIAAGAILHFGGFL